MGIAMLFCLSGLVAILVAAAGAFTALYPSRALAINRRVSHAVTGDADPRAVRLLRLCGNGMLVFGMIYAGLSWLAVLALTIGEAKSSKGW